MSDTSKNTCPILTLLWELGKQWVLLIIYEVGAGQKYFSTIKNALPGISSRPLSLRLKDLQKYDMIRRDIVSQQPVRIEYTLTKKWESFKKQLNNLCTWWQQWSNK